MIDLTDGSYDLEPEAPQEQWYKWSEFVHGEWSFYNDDNPEPEEIEAMDAFNRLTRMVSDCDDNEMVAAFNYLCRMEEAAHAAAHSIEAGLMERTDD